MLPLVLRPLCAAVALLALYALPLATPARAAPFWDPAGAIAAYSAALNAHDLPGALALFDQYGSATDIRGRHYEGAAALTEFLLASGFGQADAHVQTERVHIVANRAEWTYSCSCAAGLTEVRLVTNQNKISVFAIMPPPSGPIRKAEGQPMLWLFAAGLVVLCLLGGIFVRLRHRADRATLAGRGTAHGHLLLPLARACPSRIIHGTRIRAAHGDPSASSGESRAARSPSTSSG